ncbi:MAG: glycosyltransferase family 2 protein [Bacteroidia bacterium]|nr:glycosyltransferase family 2 protein [Bacteroidia bacterium]
MKLSIVMPAYNEAESIPETVQAIYDKLSSENIVHQILVVNDNSKDNTVEVLTALKLRIPTLDILTNEGPNGFGYAVRKGLENFNGDCVAVVMADLSDSPDDIVKFYFKMLEGYDCVFGTRWSKGGKVYNYPFHKLYLNRFFNNVVRILFGIKYNDVTNAFKMYKKETIQGIQPFLSPHFNLTVELPLKAIIRGYTYVVLPNSWINRKHGVSKLKIREMGSRYFFILLYCLIEKFFSRGDFKKKWD